MNFVITQYTQLTSTSSQESIVIISINYKTKRTYTSWLPFAT